LSLSKSPTWQMEINSRYTMSYGAIGIIFFISGLSIPPKTLMENVTKYRLHIIVQVTSYLVSLVNSKSNQDLLGCGIWICFGHHRIWN
jgi:hypothetical protein